MTETPSHAELEAAIEQARETLERQTVTRTDSGFPHPPQVANFGVAAAVDAHLDTLTELLDLAAEWQALTATEIAGQLRARVATALREMGALT